MRQDFDVDSDGKATRPIEAGELVSMSPETYRKIVMQQPEQTSNITTVEVLGCPMNIELDDTNRPSGTYKTTPLGQAWVKALCSVPKPQQRFVDEQGRLL